MNINLENSSKSAGEGLVLDIQRMSTEDGPGLRTTAFLKGCPLRCEWCHNPESISPDIEIEYFPDRCMGCGECINNCGAGALSMGPDGIVRNLERCNGCLECCTNCPALAMQTKGNRYTSETLTAELIKDRAFFGKEGGVTISGGEALFQPEFTAAVLRLLKKEGIGTAVDTCGLCPWTAFEAVLPYTDLFLYDIKIIDPAEHKKHTGADNSLILENIKRLASCIRTYPEQHRLWIRTPVIPGATDSDENIWAIAEFIRSELGPAVERWEMCAFNNLCTAKYSRFGKDWKYKDAELQTAGKMNILRKIALSAGLPENRVYATGMTA